MWNESNISNAAEHEETTLFWPKISIAYGVEALITMHILTMLVSIPGNLLTITVITKSKSLLDETAYLLICSVSVADFMVSIFSQPLNVAVLIIGTDNIPGITHQVLYFCIWGFCGASAFGVVCITFDRFLYIMHPMHYTVLLSRKRTYIMITVQWLCGLAYGVLPLINIKASAFPTAVAALVTLILMTGCMAVVYNQVYRNIKRLNQQQRRHSKRKQNNATITISFVVLAFFICWFPYIITNCIQAAGDYNSTSPIRGIYYWFVGLGCWNSAFNVFIYGFKNSTLKHEAKKFLKRKQFRIGPGSKVNKNSKNCGSEECSSTKTKKDDNPPNVERQAIGTSRAQAYSTFNKDIYSNCPIQQLKNIHNNVKALVIGNIRILSNADVPANKMKSPLTTNTDWNKNIQDKCILENYSSEERELQGFTPVHKSGNKTVSEKNSPILTTIRVKEINSSFAFEEDAASLNNEPKGDNKSPSNGASLHHIVSPIMENFQTGSHMNQNFQHENLWEKFTTLTVTENEKHHNDTATLQNDMKEDEKENGVGKEMSNDGCVESNEL